MFVLLSAYIRQQCDCKIFHNDNTNAPLHQRIRDFRFTIYDLRMEMAYDLGTMQKMAKGEIEERVREMRGRLLAAVEGTDAELLQQPEQIGDYSIEQTIGYLGAWFEQVNQGLREVQRRKKPTDLLRWHDDGTRFMRDAVEDSADLPLEEKLERLDDALIQFEARMIQFNHDDLNRPKRIRFLGNKPLWPLIAALTYEHEEKFVEQIEGIVERNA